MRANGVKRAKLARIATSLFRGVVSIVPTRRRRLLWAAWWSAPPAEEPFRKPDASSGGARTREDAVAEAERAAGQALVETEARWAAAWARVLRGDDPWARRVARGTPDAVAQPPTRGSRAWAFGLLGLTTAASPEDVKRAFRVAALRTHPDRGGDDAAFIEAKRAYDVALGQKKKRRG